MRADTDTNGAAGDPRSFASAVRNAVIWRSGTQIFGQLVSWVSTFLVLRILAPSDYGLVAMTAAVMLLLSLVNGYGFANAVIQRKHVTDLMLRQLFGMTLLFNLGLAVVQVLAAPIAADYYNMPLVRDMLYVQTLHYLTTPFIVVGYTILSREMDFKRQAQVNFAAAIVAALSAIGGALAGWGVWTLVWAPIFGVAVRAVGMTWASGWFKLPSFDFRGAGFIMRFGGIVLVGNLFWFAQTQADVFIVGRVFSAHDLGIYTTALFLTQIFINKVVPPLNEVAFSAYSRINEGGAVAPAFLTSLGMIMVAGMPVFVGLAVSADPMVRVVLGAKWLETIPFVALLGLAMPFMAIVVLFAPALNAIDRPDVTTRNAFVGALILPASYLIGLRWGLTGVAAAWIVGYPLLLTIVAWRTLPLLGVTFVNFGRALAPALSATVAMAMATTIAGRAVDWPSAPVELAAIVAVGALSYLGWLVVFYRPEITRMIALIRDRG